MYGRKQQRRHPTLRRMSPLQLMLLSSQSHKGWPVLSLREFPNEETALWESALAQSPHIANQAHFKNFNI